MGHRIRLSSAPAAAERAALIAYVVERAGERAEDVERRLAESPPWLCEISDRDDALAFADRVRGRFPLQVEAVGATAPGHAPLAPWARWTGVLFGLAVAGILVRGWLR
jgi:hypothetical protein